MIEILTQDELIIKTIHADQTSWANSSLQDDYPGLFTQEEQPLPLFKQYPRPSYTAPEQFERLYNTPTKQPRRSMLAPVKPFTPARKKAATQRQIPVVRVKLVPDNTTVQPLRRTAKSLKKAAPATVATAVKKQRASYSGTHKQQSELRTHLARKAARQERNVALANKQEARLDLEDIERALLEEQDALPRQALESEPAAAPAAYPVIIAPEAILPDVEPETDLEPLVPEDEAVVDLEPIVELQEPQPQQRRQRVGKKQQRKTYRNRLPIQ